MHRHAIRSSRFLPLLLLALALPSGQAWGEDYALMRRYGASPSYVLTGIGISADGGSAFFTEGAAGSPGVALMIDVALGTFSRVPEGAVLPRPGQPTSRDGRYRAAATVVAAGVEFQVIDELTGEVWVAGVRAGAAAGATAPIMSADGSTAVFRTSLGSGEALLVADRFARTTAIVQPTSGLATAMSISDDGLTIASGWRIPSQNREWVFVHRRAEAPLTAVARELFVVTDPGVGTASVEAAAFDGGSSDPRQRPLSFSATPASPYPIGITAVTLHVSNGFATASTQTRVTVREAPLVASARELVVVTDPGVGTASVEASAFDDGSHDALLRPLSFSVVPAGPYPIGITEVTLHVSNGLAEASAQTRVTVHEAPLVARARELVLETDPDLDTASVEASAFDDGSHDALLRPLGFSAVPAGPYPIGITEVTLHVSNGLATASAQTRVTVREAPLVARARELSLVTESGLATASVEAIAFDDGSRDALQRPLSFSVAPAGPYPVGTTEVTLHVSNGVATASARTRVTVHDEEAPRISCRVDRPLLLVPLFDRLVDVGLHMTGSDNCALASVVVSVTQDEAVHAAGDPRPDAEVLTAQDGSVTALLVRSQRDPRGDGRVYLVRVTATDIHGNSASDACAVVVPKRLGVWDLLRVVFAGLCAEQAGQPLEHDSQAWGEPAAAG